MVRLANQLVFESNLLSLVKYQLKLIFISRSVIFFFLRSFQGCTYLLPFSLSFDSLIAPELYLKPCKSHLESQSLTFQGVMP